MNTPFLYPIKEVYDFVPHDYDAIVAKQMDLATVRYRLLLFHSVSCCLIEGSDVMTSGWRTGALFTLIWYALSPRLLRGVISCWFCWRGRVDIMLVLSCLFVGLRALELKSLSIAGQTGNQASMLHTSSSYLM